MKFRTLMAMLVVVLATGTSATALDFAVVVSKKNPATQVTTSDLSKILKGITRSWPNGNKTVLFFREPEAGDIQAVLRKIYGMSPEEAQAFLVMHKSDIVFVASDAAVIDSVERNVGAIGMVNVYSIRSGVTVLKVNGKLPLERGYALHSD